MAPRAQTPIDSRGPCLDVTSLRSVGPQRLAVLHRQRARAEQAIEELLTGMDLDQTVGSSLVQDHQTILLAHPTAGSDQVHHPPWTGRLVRLVA